MKTALITYLLAQTAITNLVGTRIKPNRLDETTLPAIVVRKSGGEHIRTFDGPIGCAQPSFTIRCYGTSSLQADAVADAVRLRLDGFGPGTMGTVSVKEVVVEDEDDVFDPPADGSDDGFYAVDVDVRITHAETVPSL